jgi:hypothetical protein
MAVRGRSTDILLSEGADILLDMARANRDFVRSMRLTLPAELVEALERHCRRSGIQRRRAVAAAMLAYLRADAAVKLKWTGELYHWRVERQIRAAWRRARRQSKPSGRGVSADTA